MGNDKIRSIRNGKNGGVSERKSRLSFGASNGARQTPELGKVGRAAEIMDFVIKAGDAIVVSTTSDGGAVVVTVLAGDSREKAYASGQMELDGIFDQIEEAYSPA
jgi:hypothetical protein